MRSLALLCVGGGRGERFGSDKLAEPLGGRLVLEVAAAALSSAFPQAPVVVVVPASRRGFWKEHLLRAGLGASLVNGGERRQDSVRNGVEVAAAAGAQVVAVHDAARPLVDASDVRRVVDGLGDAEGAVLCSRVADTVKQVDEQGWVERTVPRDRLRLSLTPQVFRVSALMQAWQSAGANQDWTDEAALLEAVGLRVRAVEARHPNPKVTTRADLELVRAMLGARA